jgi:hypothetical protein
MGRLGRSHQDLNHFACECLSARSFAFSGLVLAMRQAVQESVGNDSLPLAVPIVGV